MSVNNNKQELKSGKKIALPKPNAAAIIAIAATVIIFAVFLVFCYVNKLNDALRVGLLLLVAYTFIVVGASIFLYLKRASVRADITAVRETEDFPLGILARLDQPTAVCNEEGEIVWMNKNFAMRSHRQVLISENLEVFSVLDFTASTYVGTNKELPIPETLSAKELFNTLIDNSCGATAKGVRTFGGEFTVHAYPHISNNSVFFIIVLTEDTERNAWITKHNNNLTHIAYIAVDNLNELAQSDQESYRNASNSVAAIIKEWSTEYGAFIKEYEREKYVTVISHKSLIEIEKRKFDLLDRVSKIRIGSENLSVTVSVGVSSEQGGLEEKDKAAQVALETALARGGNQAVVTADPMRYYGAKAITSLKRSGVRHRVFADKLMYRIQHCSNVIIMGHRNPDFDAIGSCIGLARLALSMDKPTIIIGNKEEANTAVCLERLKEVSGKYSYLIVNATEAQDTLTSDTLVICTDVNNPDNFEAINVASNADYLFIIDHHRQSEKTPEQVPERCETLIVPSASSACELVSEILELELPENARLYPAEADVMFAGILLDTKNFTRNTQVHTFGAAIYLRNNGADPNKAHALFKIDLDGFRTESAFSTDLEIYRSNIVIAKETGSESSPEKRITAAKTADRLLNIKGMNVSFVVARMLNDVFISARSDGTVNVQLIMEMLKGGGHYNAAATMLKEITVDEAVEKLKEAITAYHGTNDEVQDNNPRGRKGGKNGKGSRGGKSGKGSKARK